MNENLLRLEDLVNNPTTRVPICLCLDTSGSMDGDPINELNEGVKLFYDSIRDDEVAMYSAEICIITFGGDVLLIEDFDSIERQTNIPWLNADGMTFMGEAVNMALDCLETRKKEYKDKGVDFFQPWLVLMTDGEPNGEPQELYRAIARTQALVAAKKLTIFPIAIGDKADIGLLSKFSPNFSPFMLKGVKFCEFFAWLSQSVVQVSQAMPGEKITFDMQRIKNWAVL
jgi:uncharacterized protein YegL